MIKNPERILGTNYGGFYWCARRTYDTSGGIELEARHSIRFAPAAGSLIGRSDPKTKRQFEILFEDPPSADLSLRGTFSETTPEKRVLHGIVNLVISERSGLYVASLEGTWGGHFEDCEKGLIGAFALEKSYEQQTTRTNS